MSFVSSKNTNALSTICSLVTVCGKVLALLAVLCMFTTNCFAKDNIKYWIQFKDKKGTKYFINKPHDFLSNRAIQRRQAQHIKITEEDLPVSKIYTDSLQKLNIRVIGTSKWLNGAIIETDTNYDILQLAKLNFIDTLELTYQTLQLRSTSHKFDELPAIDPELCKESFYQLALHNGQLLHDQGYTGKDLYIAIIDGGFNGTNDLPVFSAIRAEKRIIAQRNFVSPSNTINWTDNHGMQVFSVLGGYLYNEYRGSAPDASYILCKTEDETSEFPVEADYWILAAEYADSIGADIINTSLGYCSFQNSSMNYQYKDLDGRTLRISKAADIAATKGMLIVNSAGNIGKENSQKILAPADAENIISVGSVNTDSTHTNYSSYGPNATGAIKPNVMSVGYQTAVQAPNGNIAFANGTSYATPIISGLAACLWQALPTKTAIEIKELIEASSNKASSPDTILGYGIPDFWKAYNSAIYNGTLVKNEPIVSVYPNPATDYVIITNSINAKWLFNLRNMRGEIVPTKARPLNNNSLYLPTSHLPTGIYILQLNSTNHQWSRMLIIE